MTDKQVAQLQWVNEQEVNPASSFVFKCDECETKVEHGDHFSVREFFTDHAGHNTLVGKTL